MYEVMGIEIGKEGMTSEQSRLAGSIGTDARRLAASCAKDQLGNGSSTEMKRLKAQISKLQRDKAGLIRPRDCPKAPSTCPKCQDCSQFTAVLKKIK